MPSERVLLFRVEEVSVEAVEGSKHGLGRDFIEGLSPPGSGEGRSMLIFFEILVKER